VLHYHNRDEQEAQLVLHYHNRDVTTPATRWVTAGRNDWPTDWCYDLSQNRQTAEHGPCTVRLYRISPNQGGSQPERTGGTRSKPTFNRSSAIWCCRRTDANQNTSVFAVLSCSLFDRIHEPTSLTYADIRLIVAVHYQQNVRNYRFVCHRHRDVAVTHVFPLV